MSQKLKLCTIVSVLISIMLCSDASAQRTMKGQSAPSLSAVRTDSSYGGELTYNQYTLVGMWNAGVRVSDYTLATTTEYPIEAIQIAATSSYLARIAATRSRRLNVYGGGGIFLGYEFFDPFKKLPEHIVTESKSGCFVYGILAKTELEFFLSRQFAIVGTAAIPINFQSQTGWFHWEAGIGIRINI